MRVMITDASRECCSAALVVMYSLAIAIAILKEKFRTRTQ